MGVISNPKKEESTFITVSKNDVFALAIADDPTIFGTKTILNLLDIYASTFDASDLVIEFMADAKGTGGSKATLVQTAVERVFVSKLDIFKLIENDDRSLVSPKTISDLKDVYEDPALSTNLVIEFLEVDTTP